MITVRISVGAAAAVLMLALPPCPSAQGQRRAGAEGTFRISSNLVLVDVIASDTRSGNPIEGLKQEDFQVFDEGHAIAVDTFDAGDAARPIVLWFVVQCNMQGWEAQGSGMFHGQIDRLVPGIKKLGKRDLVAVAHWCDDGSAAIDLKPTAHADQAENAIEAALTPLPDTPSHDRIGELALQSALQKIVAASSELASGAVPVVVFLYGDYSAMPKTEADRLVNALLQTSAVVYGLKNSRSPHMGSFWLAGVQGSVADYMAGQTGGQYFAETADRYATAFETILDRLHSRYELGFKPRVLDGKRHRLRVELTEQAKRTYGEVRLRYRVAYVPTSETEQ